ncbi:MAG: prepilin-type cleavage/methylation domain-containing protein [Meiothermus sp.]
MKTSGFSLIEALVALVILGIALAAIVPGFIGYFNVNNNQEVRSQAVIAAQRVLEEKRTVDPNTMPRSGSDPAQTISAGGRTFTYVVTYREDATNSCTVSCRFVRVDIIYGGGVVYAAETAYTQLNAPVITP